MKNRSLRIWNWKHLWLKVSHLIKLLILVSISDWCFLILLFQSWIMMENMQQLREFESYFDSQYAPTFKLFLNLHISFFAPPQFETFRSELSCNDMIFRWFYLRFVFCIRTGNESLTFQAIYSVLMRKRRNKIEKIWHDPFPFINMYSNKKLSPKLRHKSKSIISSTILNQFEEAGNQIWSQFSSFRIYKKNTRHLEPIQVVTLLYVIICQSITIVSVRIRSYQKSRILFSTFFIFP